MLYYKTKMGTMVVLNIVRMKHENNYIFFQTLINVIMPLYIQMRKEAYNQSLYSGKSPSTGSPKDDIL